MLLPCIHDIFVDCATDIVNATNMANVSDVHVEQLVTSRYILSNLINHLQHHLTYKCTVRKYGTIILRPNTDLIPILSKALWDIHTLKKRQTQNLTRNMQGTVEIDHSALPNHSIQDVNQLIHAEIRKLLQKDMESPFEHHSINLDKLIEETDQRLWETICSLTESVSERRTAGDKTSESQSHTKKVRRYFLLCCLLFCTDSHCSFPLHTLVTDAVESQGGSTNIIKMLNRLGVCASSDTLARFIQHKVSTQSVSNSTTSESFTVVSADNIDFLHSYARVFQGKQTGSWHGTSVQVVQPLPSLESIQCGAFTHTEPSLGQPAQHSQSQSALGQPTQHSQSQFSLGQPT